MDSRKSFSSSRSERVCVSVCAFVCMPDCCSLLVGLAVPQPVWSSRIPSQHGNVERSRRKIHIWKIYWSTVFFCELNACVCVYVEYSFFFCASSFWLAEIYFLLKTFCCKQWEMAKQTLQLSAGKLNLFLLKSIELISVEEVSNFQMQTANLCESSAFSTAAPFWL